MTKKRTSLDSILSLAVEEAAPATPPAPAEPMHAAPAPDTSKRPDVKQQTAYLPPAIYEQLRRLAFEERLKMHDYLLEGLDLVFRKRGLPGIDELRRKGQ